MEDTICHENSTPRNTYRRYKPDAAEKRVMSLLGFGDNEYQLYWAWTFNNKDLNNVLLSAQAGDIVRFNTTNENGTASSFDWMVVEYSDGYSFYDPRNRSRITQSNSPNFASDLSNFVTGAGEFNQQSDSHFVQGISTPGFKTDSSITLPENWNRPIDGGIIVPAISNRSAIGLYGGAAMASWGTSFLPLMLFGLYLSYNSAINMDTVPRYKHPYGP